VPVETVTLETCIVDGMFLLFHSSGTVPEEEDMIWTW